MKNREVHAAKTPRKGMHSKIVRSWRGALRARSEDSGRRTAPDLRRHDHGGAVGKDKKAVLQARPADVCLVRGHGEVAGVPRGLLSRADSGPDRHLLTTASSSPRK